MNTTTVSNRQSASLATILLLILALAGLGILVTIPLDWQTQSLISAVLLIGALWANRASKDYKVTLFLMLCSLFCTARYLWFRSSETYNFLSMQGSAAWNIDLIFVFLLLGAEFYAALILALGFFQGLKILERKPAALPADFTTWPKVDVFIPTYNEPLEVVKPTVLAALNMDYPPDRFNVYILDDGTRQEFREFAISCGSGYIVRSEHKHAKAGNINNALKQTDSELVTIFDCDHIPTRSFLQMTVGWFLEDSNLAMLQTPHFFYSPDPFERNLSIFRKVPNEGYLFYGLVQDGNDFWNATFFCGSCAVMRRTALDEIGGIAVETVTEDAHTSLRMQRNGWNTAYINLPQAAGLATAKVADHIGQRIRWARGMVQILRIDLPLLGKGLTLAQRLCYFNSTVHYLFALPRLIFLTAPLVNLMLGRVNMYGYVVTILAYAVPHLLFATITNSRIQGKFRHSFWNEVYETVLAPYILFPTMAALINPKWGKFNVTSKSTQMDRGYFDWRISRPFILLLLLNMAGIGMGIAQFGEPEVQSGTIIVNIAWASLNLINLGAAIAVTIEKRQLRSSSRIPVSLPVSLVDEKFGKSLTSSIDFSTGGVQVQAPAGWNLLPGDRIEVGLQIRAQEVNLPATVVEVEGKSVRLAFGRLSLEQDEFLAQVIYSRGDAWLNSRDAELDRPFRSFLTIMRVAVRGFLAIPQSMFGFTPGSQDPPSNAGRPRLKPRRSAATLLLLIAALLTLFSWQLRAQRPLSFAGSSRGEQAPSTFSDEQDFKQFGIRQPLILRGVDGVASVSFSLPMTKVATDASLTLRFQPASMLAQEDGTIAVSLNGSDVASVPFKSDNASGAAIHTSIISLPAELLMSENTLTFSLAARCNSCTTQQKSQLRTTVEPNSTLRIDGRLMPFANDLRLLPMPLFDSSSNRPLRLNFVFLERPTPKVLESAGLLASWLGTLADFRGTDFPVTVGSIPQGHAVVLISSSNRNADDAAFQSLAGSGVAIRDNPNDPYGKLLVVFGDSPERLHAAAQMLASSRGLSGAIAQLEPVSLKPRNAYEAPRWLPSGRASAFAEFASAEQLRVYSNASTRLYFRLAPDLYYGSRVSVPLRLGIKFNNLPKDATAHLRLKLNGAPVAERKLQSADLKGIYSETIQMSVAQLYPRNTLAFEIEYQGAEGTDRVPEMLIQKNSELDLRGVSHFVEQPRLDLFAKAGFPYTRMPDLGDTAVIVPPSMSAEQIGLYLNLMSFFGAQTGIPGYRVTVAEPSQVEKMTGKDLLVIGSGQDQPLFSRWAARLPVQLDGELPRINDKQPPLDWVWNFIRTGKALELRHLNEVLGSEAPVEAVLEGITSPVDSSRLMVALYTSSTRNSATLLRLLDKSAYNEDVFGTVAIEQAGRFTSFRVNTSFLHTGELRWTEALEYWVRRYAWIIPLFVLLAGFWLASRLEIWVNQHLNVRLRS